MDTNRDCKITSFCNIEHDPNGCIPASQVFLIANGKNLSFISVFFICISFVIPLSVNAFYFLMICQRKAGQSGCQGKEKWKKIRLSLLLFFKCCIVYKNTYHVLLVLFYAAFFFLRCASVKSKRLVSFISDVFYCLCERTQGLLCSFPESLILRSLTWQHVWMFIFVWILQEKT